MYATSQKPGQSGDRDDVRVLLVVLNVLFDKTSAQLPRMSEPRELPQCLAGRQIDGVVVVADR